MTEVEFDSTRLYAIIAECRYGIHDLSVSHAIPFIASRASLELGIFYLEKKVIGGKKMPTRHSARSRV
jgi:hypothetical protein